MIQFSNPYTPATMKRGDVFLARQYPRQAFNNLIDPVLNIDWFDMTGPTFPAHPHAGFSAVTYLFEASPNGFHNRDSLGQTHDIRPGGLHWSRASKGMIHEETPLPNGGAVRGLQIFVNLPEAHQDDEAAAFPLLPSEVALETGKGWRSRTAINGIGIGSASAALPSPVRVREVTIDVGAVYDVVLPAGWGGIVIALEGSVVVPDGVTLHETQAIGVASAEGGAFSVAAPDGAARIAIIVGQQLNQHVHAFGPLMLASPQALTKARDYVAGLKTLNPITADMETIS